MWSKDSKNDYRILFVGDAAVGKSSIIHTLFGGYKFVEGDIQASTGFNIQTGNYPVPKGKGKFPEMINLTICDTMGTYTEA
jgi:GTPase SAR1 family protein